MRPSLFRAKMMIFLRAMPYAAYYATPLLDVTPPIDAELMLLPMPSTAVIIACRCRCCRVYAEDVYDGDMRARGGVLRARCSARQRAMFSPLLMLFAIDAVYAG